MKKTNTLFCLLNVALSLMLLLVFTLPNLAASADLPLWEAGIGGAFLEFPDYRGSDEYRSYLLPIPYLIYRGKILKVDREKVRGLIFRSDKIQLEVSAGGSVPVQSNRNKARQGMPDLDPTLEIGPSLDFLLMENKEGGMKLTAHFPIRTVIASDFSHFKDVGWVFAPRLNLDKSLDFLPGKGWNLGLSTGPVLADKAYHDYFYTVDPAFATAQRPAFSARGGYSGSQITLSLSKLFANVWFGSFVKLDLLNEAAFDASPLVKSKQSVMGGLALAWIFTKSKTLVSVDK